MKIKFKDNSFINCYKNSEEKIIFEISAVDYNNPLKKITNSVELTIEEFKSLIGDV